MHGSGESDGLKTFFVELRRPAMGWQEIQAIGARSRAACRAMRERGTPVRFLRTVFVPEDDRCFLLYEAASADVVVEATSTTALPLRRVPATVVDVWREGTEGGDGVRAD